MIDVARLRKELEHITAHPEEWDQTTWMYRTTTNSCGTAGCLAGNTVLHAGEEVHWDSRGYAAYLKVKELHVQAGILPTSIAECARKLLGLDEVQAASMFDAMNSLNYLWQLASQYTNGEIKVPADLPEWAYLDAGRAKQYIRAMNAKGGIE
jgi:hypothetical protein